MKVWAIDLSGTAQAVPQIEQQGRDPRLGRGAPEGGQPIGQCDALDLVEREDQRGEAGVFDEQLAERAAIERADFTIGKRGDRLRRFGVDHAGYAQHIAGEQEPQDLATAVVQQHIAHHQAAPQDVEFAAAVLLALQRRAAPYVAATILQPHECRPARRTSRKRARPEPRRNNCQPRDEAPRYANRYEAA